jgi:hypothetical protein
METRKESTVSTRRTLMQEKLDALVRTQAMQLFRQQGLHFTMQQVAEPLSAKKPSTPFTPPRRPFCWTW